jgi:tRNA G18 (ribose-2'-O)-methylase SpoU
MVGRIESLSVSQAAAILLAEAARQRITKESLPADSRKP